jgi:hypothetical protein
MVARAGVAIATGLPLGLCFGLPFGLSSGLLTGIVSGLFAVLVTNKIKVSSLENTGFGWIDASSHLSSAFRSGLVYGLLFAERITSSPLVKGKPAIVLVLGLVTGWLFASRQFVLLLCLCLCRSAPLFYSAFLAEAKDLLFLRQVGGGYIFTHRLLREYFASLSQPEAALQVRASK